MGVSDARRLEVYEQARAHWGDGPAEPLMETVVPPGQDMATRQDVEAASGRLQEMFKGLEVRFDALEARMTKLDERSAKLEERFAVLEERTSHLATRSFVLASQVPLSLLVVGLYFTG
jgi:predicted nuclease with TOPRIM domain